MKFFDLEMDNELAKKKNAQNTDDLKAFKIHSLACSQTQLLFQASHQHQNCIKN